MIWYALVANEYIKGQLFQAQVTVNN